MRTRQEQARRNAHLHDTDKLTYPLAGTFDRNVMTWFALHPMSAQTQKLGSLKVSGVSSSQMCSHKDKYEEGRGEGGARSREGSLP